MEAFGRLYQVEEDPQKDSYEGALADVVREWEVEQNEELEEVEHWKLYS